MKNNLGRRITKGILVVLLMIPLLWLQGETDVLAATPAFAESKIEIVGEGTTYQLEIKNKVSGSTYKWSSSNAKVARVSSKGVVTAVGKGTAEIKCVITYPNKNTKTLTCKVTVIIPATKLKINNAVEVNGAHIMKIGETYNFNRDIFPSNSSDKTYWSLGAGDKNCVQVTDSSSGIVKALKPGKVVLVATAARTATAEAAASSIVNDAIIIEVIEPSAAVTSVKIVDNNVISVVFDSPVIASTVIGQNGTLHENIIITPLKNAKGVYASDPGNLTAALSQDGKTLTITSANRLDGDYGIYFSDQIKTTDGISIDDYYQRIRYIDETPPHVVDVRQDDTGVVLEIVFNEEIDFSGLKVSGGGIMQGSSTKIADPRTVSILNNRNSYVPSEDKKSLRINLANIAPTDFNQPLTVTLSGIKDMAGNSPSGYSIQVVLVADNTPKPKARLVSVVRTGYYTLTATFDRSLLTAGYAQIGTGPIMVGTVDSNNPRKAYYTLSETDALKTGIQSVTVSNWTSFNMNPNDTYITRQTVSVSFDYERSNPVLMDYTFDPATNILTLTYNEDVTLVTNSGFFTATLVTINDEIWSDRSITYAKTASDDPKVIRLQLGNLTVYGNYTFTLSQYFVMDSFRNYGLQRTITISNIGDVQLPGPYSIMQSTNNPSEIYLEFAHMLDVATATDVRNYEIPGVTILGARLTKNTKNEGATVVLTVADGSINVTLERPLRINGVASYSGNYSPITDFEKTVLLKENVKPYYIAPPLYNSAKPNEIRLTFSEEITGSMVVKVTQTGTGTYDIPIGNIVTISGNTVVITLNTIPTNNSLLKIDITDNKIVDLSGNQCVAMDPTLYFYVTY